MGQDCNDKKTTAMADTLPGPDCFKHSTDIQIRFNDIDMLGHLNNTMYFSYFDIGKADYFNAIRRTDNHWGHLDIVIVNVNCDFMSQVRYTERIAVKTRVSYIRNKSFEVLQEMVDKDSNEIKAVCRTVMVGFDPATGKSAPLSHEWKKAIADFEGF